MDGIPTKAVGKVRIGISGWRYAGWRGVFYPPKLAQRRELEFASREFSTIEINGTFYSLHRPKSFAKWISETPDDFVFSLKGSRYITHLRRLLEVEKPLANFFAQGLLQFGEKLGPFLWQFPPNFKYERERLERFFRLLPRSAKQAARLARRHDERMDEHSWTSVKQDRPLRHCIEIRHESFAMPEFIELLREYSIGLVVADTVEWPLLMDVPAILCTVGCMVRSSCMRAAMAMLHLICGQRGWLRGREGKNLQTDDLRIPHGVRARNHVMYMFTSTTI
ncbi:MAG TPA: DUF72 domain-containing protein [Edaphobacter sp.]|nr:DUF72 domain-containing protein [Edaphobacter sp.]